MDPPRIRAFATRVTSPHSPDSLFHGWTDPSPLVTAPAERRRARLLAGILLVFTPIGVLSSALTAAYDGLNPVRDPVALYGFIASLSGAGLYILARSRHVQTAAIGTVVSALFGGWATTFASAGTENAGAAPYFVTISIIVASALLPLRHVVATAVANMVGIIAFPQVAPGIGYYDVLTVSIFIFMLSGFLIVFTIVRGRDLAQIETQAHDLEASEAGLQAIMESTPDRILVVDRDGRVQQANEGGAGAVASPLVGSSIFDHVPAASAGPLREALHATFEQQQATTLEAPGHGAFASIGWVQHVVGPIRHEDQVLAAVWIVRDRTEERNSERARLDRVARDAELARLHEMADFKAQFLNMAAHEICTPLTPIKISVRALNHPKLTETDRQEVVDRIGRGVERMHGLLTGFLDAARLDAGRLPMEPEPQNLARLVHEVADAYLPMAEERDRRLIVDIDGPLAVHADPGRIMQVMTNLVDNAFKYSNEGATIRITARATDGIARVEVVDNGRGFPPEAHGELFQPFNRLAERVGARTEGTGLGLYICRGVIEQHGGQLWGESDGEGKGARFGFTLPLVQCGEDGITAVAST